MPVQHTRMRVNFKEIPQANTGAGDQDTFELFARDFLIAQGYSIIREPGRGADKGRDLIIREERKGVGGTTNVDWLVSCKHYAHSGKSVGPNDEQNVSDRVCSHNCNGFIGFYSTIPSDSLVEMLKGARESKHSSVKECQFFDRERIEGELLGRSNFLRIFARYFPIFFPEWIKLITADVPIKVFRWFMEEKYGSLKEFFEKVFGSSEASIIPIKQSTSFEKLMQEAGITCLYEEVLDRLPDMKITDFSSYVEGKSYTLRDLIWQLPQAEFKSVTLQEEPILVSNFYSPPLSHQGQKLYEGQNEGKLSNETAIYFLYENYLVYNKNAQQMFDSLFRALKDILS